MLFVLYLTSVVVYNTLLITERSKSVSAKLRCDCSFFPRRRPHWGNVMLFVHFLSALTCLLCVLGVSVVGTDRIVVVWSLPWMWWAYRAFQDWRKHSKNSRKRLIDKVTGRVKVTVAGLKVIPVPVSARTVIPLKVLRTTGTRFTVLALIGALSACGASPEPDAAPTSPEPNNSVTQIEQKVTYPDGSVRTVQCLLYDSYKRAGLSCDWERGELNR